MKKIMPLVLVLLLLSIIPSSLASHIPKNIVDTTSECINRTFIRGFILFPRIRNQGNSLTFFALRVHYRTITLEGVLNGLVRIRPLTIPNTLTGYIGKGYIIGTFHGKINIVP